MSMKRLAAGIRGLGADDSGATMLEYALMIALVAAVCIAGALTLGVALAVKFFNAASSI